MRGVTFLGERKLALAEFPDPTPGPHDVVVAIKASGMCGSDLKPYRASGGSAALGLGKVSGPVIAGHEPCGVVAAAGSAVDERMARIGTRVMVHHYAGCGTCRHCQTGWTQMCSSGSTVYGITGHGAHAPYMKVPATTLVPLPDALQLCHRGCDFMRHRHRLSGAAAHEACRRRHHRRGRPGAGRPVGDAACRGDGRPRHRARRQRRAAGARQGIRRRGLDRSDGRRCDRRHQDAHPRRRRRYDTRHLRHRRRTTGRGARHARLGAQPALSAKAATSPSTSARRCCASSSRSSALGLFPPPCRPIARALSPTARSTSIICSRTAGGSTKPTRPTGCSIGRPAAKACS